MRGKLLTPTTGARNDVSNKRTTCGRAQKLKLVRASHGKFKDVRFYTILNFLPFWSSLIFSMFHTHNEFWPFFGISSPLTIHICQKTMGGGGAKGEPGGIARERRTKENKDNNTWRKTKTNRNKTTKKDTGSGTNKKVRVFWKHGLCRLGV